MGAIRMLFDWLIVGPVAGATITGHRVRPVGTAVSVKRPMSGCGQMQINKQLERT